MILSKDLNAQIERYRRTKSFALDAPLKKELKDVIRVIKGYTLNAECGTCCRNAMRELDAYMSQVDEVPLLQKREVTPFIGIKQKPFEEMTYSELKAIAKEKGITGNIKRDELIRRIKNS